MAEENLGSGIELTQSFDFTLTPDGDIATVSGTEEINKDIAFQLSIILSPFEGSRLTPSVKNKIKSRTIDTLNSDNRVNTVDSSSITVRGVGDGTIRVDANYFAGGTQQELIFEL
jgi:hypothetical protein